MLGLGTNIPDAAGLPTMDADGKIPKDLGKKYGKMILDADGFAQVCLGVCGVWFVRCKAEKVWGLAVVGVFDRERAKGVY
jgi:hypothetical protein